MGFGLLRVINDDTVQPSKGFATHAHHNMEIISIPLSGALSHKDNKGNEHIIHADDVQIMSAGSGISHSEYNYSNTEPVNFLQIWVLPNQKNINPRYAQKTFSQNERQNKLQLLISPNHNSESIWINQNAYFSMTELDKTRSLQYKSYTPGTGTYLFVIAGMIQILSVTLSARDGIGITEEHNLTIQALEHSKILCIEAPMA